MVNSPYLHFALSFFSPPPPCFEHYWHRYPIANPYYTNTNEHHSYYFPVQDGGTCMDWVYGQLGVKYSFTVKLQNRYGGSDGYKLRPAFIPATVKEAFLGVKTLCDAMNV